MKIDNRNRVRVLRKSIEEIITVLKAKLTFDDDSGSEIKGSVKTKKNAFLKAKYLLGKLQELETVDSRNDSSDWYKDTIELMVQAAEDATTELSEVLRLGVNKDEKSSAINSAIDAKQEAYDYMSEIHSGVVELNGVLKSIEDGEGVKLLNTNDFKSGYAEDHAYYGFFRKKKRKIQPEYNKDMDAVVISYDGTVGEIINCYGLKIALPKAPKKNSFSNFRKKAEDQYWVRPELPDGLNAETAHIYEAEIEEEFVRRDEGYWFMNEGKPEYITGANYMLLTYFKADAEQGKYFHFRKAHRDLFYFLEAVWLDKRCLGTILGKARRTGATHVADAFHLTKAISSRDALFGLTSKKNIDAKRAFQKLSLMFRDVPFFFKPINTGEGLSSSLVFKTPAKRATKKNQNKEEKHDDLNTILDYESTSEDSYDGSALRHYIADECFDPNTKILMGDMSFKEIKDINVGDEVTVEGGNKIKIKKKMQGIDEMYEVIQPHRENYIVSSKHRLYFNHGGSSKRNKKITITPNEYLSMSSCGQRLTTSVVSNGFEFEHKQLLIDPYFLGYWLGDGTSSTTMITYSRKSFEAIEYIRELLLKYNITESIKEESDNWLKIKYNPTSGRNVLLDELVAINVRNNKHIPKDYLHSSRTQRLKLLAGIIDSDGHKVKTNKNFYKLAMANHGFVKQIYKLVKELGIECSEIGHRKSNFNTDVYEIHITDYFAQIPCVISYKKPEATKYKNRRGKVDVRPIGIGEYIGISVDSDDINDQRLILKDYTISMNCSKWTEGEDILSHFDKVKLTLLSGGIVRGKMFMLSTVEGVTGEEYDSEGAKNGDRFKHLFNESKLDKRDVKTGQTPSRLYSIFISAIDNFGGFIDKYGNCVAETPKDHIIGVNGEVIDIGVREHLEDLWATYKDDPSRLNDEKRKNPITEEDMFRIASDMSLFDTVKIQDQLDHNSKKFLSEGKHDYRVGNFRYTDNTNTKVEFFECSNGRFKVAWMPDVYMRNGVENRGGVLYPANENIGIFGIDPYKFSETGDGKGSKGAIVGYLMDHPIDGIPKETFFLLYLAKPQTVEIFIEDAIMCMKFYGFPALIENNIPRILEDMLRMGVTKYAMRRPDKSKLTFDERKMGGIPSTDPKLILDEAVVLEKYISDHIGYDKDGDIGTCPFNELLNDWLTFNIKNRTKFDATVASCLAVYGARKYLLSNIREKKTRIKATDYYKFVGMNNRRAI